MWVSFPKHNLVVTPMVYLHRCESGTLPDGFRVKIIHFHLFIAEGIAMAKQVWLWNFGYLNLVTTFTPSSMANIAHSDSLQYLSLWVSTCSSLIDVAYLDFLWCLSMWVSTRSSVIDVAYADFMWSESELALVLPLLMLPTWAFCDISGCESAPFFLHWCC